MAGPGDSAAGPAQVQAGHIQTPHPASRGSQGTDTKRRDADHSGRGQRGRGGRRGGRGGNNRGRESGNGPQRPGRGNPERNPAPAKVQASKLSSDATAITGDAVSKGGELDVEEAEAEVCFICASPVVHQSVAPCNHRTCHICALRLRALYKTRACAHCRASTPSRIVQNTLTCYRRNQRSSFSRMTRPSASRTSRRPTSRRTTMHWASSTRNWKFTTTRFCC